MTISQGIKYVQRRLLCSTWILRAVTNSIRQPEPKYSDLMSVAARATLVLRCLEHTLRHIVLAPPSLNEKPRVLLPFLPENAILLWTRSRQRKIYRNNATARKKPITFRYSSDITTSFPPLEDNARDGSTYGIASNALYSAQSNISMLEK
ncbi:unnamed protein product [Albugo candida]|uniref:Uncharacterized protein n=1 Tax=Albugo candida TaxID=65357 RepID=A0A024G5D1_9STRA|nr:unnamed protein product [Albugo candida]|eukprot:CCI41867.1 unnamed protein product [Albugo candida]